jgi:hypothetical protein
MNSLKLFSQKKFGEWRFAFLGVIVVLFVFLIVACPNPAGSSAAPASGTLTFTITDATVHNTKRIMGMVMPTGVTYTGSNNVAESDSTPSIITGGTASIVFKNNGTTTPWIGTAGSTYDVYVLVDVDSDGQPTLGEPAIGGTTNSVTINGNTTLTKPLSAFGSWSP